jgi:hypothetical protein
MAKKTRTFSDARVDRDKIRFARFTRIVIRLVAAGLVLVFAYLQLKGIRTNTVLTSSTADIIWRVALVIYFWTWVRGVSFDADIQELAYVTFPGQGKWSMQAIGVLALFIVVAWVLLASYGDIIHFSLALTAFLIVDHGIWFFMRRFLRGVIDQSRARYTHQKQYYELEILKTVVGQVFGKWKLWRLIPGTLIVLTADLFAFSESFRDASTSVAHVICPWLSLEETASLFYSFLVLLFVIVMEIWHWLLRVRTNVRVDTLEYLQRSYRLEPR